MQVEDELHRRIIAACETVTSVMLQETWREVEYGLDICHATKSAHVEIYRGTPKLGKLLHFRSEVLMLLSILV